MPSYHIVEQQKSGPAPPMLVSGFLPDSSVTLDGELVDSLAMIKTASKPEPPTSPSNRRLSGTAARVVPDEGPRADLQIGGFSAAGAGQVLLPSTEASASRRRPSSRPSVVVTGLTKMTSEQQQQQQEGGSVKPKGLAIDARGATEQQAEPASASASASPPGSKLQNPRAGGVRRSSLNVVQAPGAVVEGQRRASFTAPEFSVGSRGVASQGAQQLTPPPASQAGRRNSQPAPITKALEAAGVSSPKGLAALPLPCRGLGADECQERPITPHVDGMTPRRLPQAAPAGRAAEAGSAPLSLPLPSRGLGADDHQEQPSSPLATVGGKTPRRLSQQPPISEEAPPLPGIGIGFGDVEVPERPVTSQVSRQRRASQPAVITRALEAASAISPQSPTSLPLHGRSFGVDDSQERPKSQAGGQAPVQQPLHRRLINAAAGAVSHRASGAAAPTPADAEAAAAGSSMQETSQTAFAAKPGRADTTDSGLAQLVTLGIGAKPAEGTNGDDSRPAEDKHMRSSTTDTQLHLLMDADDEPVDSEVRQTWSSEGALARRKVSREMSCSSAAGSAAAGPLWASEGDACASTTSSGRGSKIARCRLSILGTSSIPITLPKPPPPQQHTAAPTPRRPSVAGGGAKWNIVAPSGAGMGGCSLLTAGGSRTSTVELGVGTPTSRRRHSNSEDDYSMGKQTSLPVRRNSVQEAPAVRTSTAQSLGSEIDFLVAGQARTLAVSPMPG